jgi:predicted transcriptional regulator YdeE
MPINITIITQPQQVVYGLWGKSSDKTLPKDIPALSKKYYDTVGKPSGSILPFFVISKDYNEATSKFDLFIGGDIESNRLEAYKLPEGTYGKIVVKPKFGFIWGAAIGEAKHYFYTKWLPSSEYDAVNMEYEFHTEKSVMKKPEIELLFAIKKKQS